MFLTYDQFNPWDPATWSSNPLGLYSELKERGLIVDTLHLGHRPLANAIGYALSTLLWPHYAHRSRLELTRRITRRMVLGFLARKQIRAKLNGLPTGTRLLTCSNAVIDFSRCGLPVWHYSDACLGVALREDPASALIDAKLQRSMLRQETKNYQSLDKLLLFSQWAARSAIADHYTPAYKVSVVGHAACLPDPGTHEKIDPQGPPTVLFVCTDWQRKGGPLVLDAFKRLRQSLPAARLVVIGYLNPEKVAGVDGVEFVGKLRKDRPDELQRFIEWYRRADVLALASNYDPMPNITLEANLCGTPVVTSPVCAVTEQIESGVNGELVPHDPEAMYQALRKILSRRCATLRATSRHYVLKHHTWNQVGERISTLN